MINSNLQQTVFHIEKIKNVVNVGDLSAYHIYTSHGPVVGRLGDAISPSTETAANDEQFEVVSAQTPSAASWLERVLLALRIKA